MTDNLLLVANQVIGLFILIFIGFLLGKKKLLSDISSKHLTDLVLFLATPCVIIEAFQREYNLGTLRKLSDALITAVCIHIASILLCHILLKKSNNSRIMKFSAIFSNCGFMAIPLQTALLGNDGAFLGAAFLAVFTLFTWTYGLVLISGKRDEIKIKSLIRNPGLIGIAIGFLLFIFQINLSETVPVLFDSIRRIGALNTPIPMLIIGFYLSKADLRQALRRLDSYLVLFLRLVFIPSAALIIMKLLHVDQSITVACIAAASAPSAALCTMFAAKYDCDTELSVSLVSSTTLMSIITMPIIISLSY